MLVCPTANERLLLELLNSTPVVDGVPQDELADTVAARAWLGTHGLPATKREAEAVLELRPVLQDVVRGSRSARALAPFFADTVYRAAVTNEGVTWRPSAPAGRAAAVGVLLAWDDAQRNHPGRLRACANPECQLFLFDRSKPNSARWCSMAVCGNRLKARRHYEKSRSAAG